MLLKILELLNSGIERIRGFPIRIQGPLLSIVAVLVFWINIDDYCYRSVAVLTNVQIFSNFGTIITKVKDLKSTKLPPNFGPPL